MTMKDKEIEQLFKNKYSSSNINLCRSMMEEFGECIFKLLYPAACNESAQDFQGLKDNIRFLEAQLKIILNCIQDELSCKFQNEASIDNVCDDFFDSLNRLGDMTLTDAQFILEGDPAAKSLNEVIICYPGFYAIVIYRIAHFFFEREVDIFPRILTEYAHSKTGIDIHPGAKIDAPLFIDHGTGVVIGETAIIGKRVKIYQGVTLGAKSISKELANVKRHPTIEENCVIYSNATILGGDTVIGKNSVVGGNTWLTESVSENSKHFYKK